ncbi:MAG: hypothetical protein FJX72_14130 [Armatimonadetes bacterium]|nr:hypothetical protein [Armatimonadota bacterium]
MASAASVTVQRMVEQLPALEQRLVAQHLREYIADLRDEHDWDQLVAGSLTSLRAAARAARKQVADGQAEPFDLSRL